MSIADIRHVDSWGAFGMSIAGVRHVECCGAASPISFYAIGVSEHWVMDRDDEMFMHPEPKDSSVLHLQSTHESDLIWKADSGDFQRSIKRDPNQSRSHTYIRG
ncbi:hypothetical protein AgCh_015009 [Apium graveolens]